MMETLSLPMTPPVDQRRLEEAAELLRDYKAGKTAFENRILEEERWYRLRHWDVIRGRGAGEDPAEARPEPASAWLFNSIANKHADIMDNYPEPNVLPREQRDEEDAHALSAILPVVLQRSRYEDTYDRAAWYKLKHGVAAKGVFWNPELENGLGDVDVRFIDMLNIFWEPGVTDLQASRNLFVVDLRDNEVLEEEYPQLRGKLNSRVIDVKQYIYDDAVDISGKSVVVDWYYKKRTPMGRTLLHYCKFVGDQVLFASENQPQRYPEGFYAHGRYPVELDVLFPEEGTPVGFGYIAIMKSPQMYIDKLSQVVLENAMMSARVRYLVKDGAGISDEEFLDWSRPLVKYAGDPGNLIPLQVQQVGGNVLNVLQMKINELKETSSNRDISQGSSSGGVTAAAAIAALQEAGNKTSRDMISASYRSFTQECYLAIELIRQFYDEARCFRITGEDGGFAYVRYSNATLRGRLLPPAYPGQEREPGYRPAARVPVFEVVVKPQRRSPYSKMAQNELAKELYQLGFFRPELAEQSLAAMELMDFDGREKVKRTIQCGRTMQRTMESMEQQLQRLEEAVYRLTGKKPPERKTVSSARPSGSRRKSMGSAVTDAARATMTSYGQKLAERARPNMDAGAPR